MYTARQGCLGIFCLWTTRSTQSNQYGLGQQSEDTISLMPSQREKDSLGLLSDNEDAISCSSSDPSVTDNRNSSHFFQFLVEKRTKETQNVLSDIF